MNVHEYQAKELMAQFGVPVPKGGLAQTTEEAVDVARGLSGDVFVVKAQIHAGGRGKGGGVKVCRNLDEVKDAATRPSWACTWLPTKPAPMASWCTRCGSRKAPTSPASFTWRWFWTAAPSVWR